jgi:hypothetical protein
MLILPMLCGVFTMNFELDEDQAHWSSAMVAQGIIKIGEDGMRRCAHA